MISYTKVIRNLLVGVGAPTSPRSSVVAFFYRPRLTVRDAAVGLGPTVSGEDTLEYQRPTEDAHPSESRGK